MKKYTFGMISLSLVSLLLTASAFAETQTFYQQQEAIFNSGTELPLSQIPQYGVLKGNSVDQNSGLGYMPFYFYNNANNVLVVQPLNDSISDADAVQDLTNCGQFIPTAQADDIDNLLVTWQYFSNVRALGLANNTINEIDQVQVLFRIATDPATGKQVVVAREDDEEPGFSYAGNDFGASYNTGFYYITADSITPVTPSSVTPQCGQLFLPYTLVNVQPYIPVAPAPPIYRGFDPLRPPACSDFPNCQENFTAGSAPCC